MPEPYTLLLLALKQRKFMQFALAVVGLAAAVAMVATFQIAPQVAVFGALVAFAMMVCLLLFSYLARSGPRRHAALASCMAWAFLGLAVIGSALFLSSYFFRWPRDLGAEPATPQLLPCRSLPSSPALTPGHSSARIL